MSQDVYKEEADMNHVNNFSDIHQVVVTVT